MNAFLIPLAQNTNIKNGDMSLQFPQIFQATAFSFHQRVTASRQKSGVDCLVLIL